MGINDKLGDPEEADNATNVATIILAVVVFFLALIVVMDILTHATEIKHLFPFHNVHYTNVSKADIHQAPPIPPPSKRSRLSVWETGYQPGYHDTGNTWSSSHTRVTHNRKYERAVQARVTETIRFKDGVEGTQQNLDSITRTYDISLKENANQQSVMTTTTHR